jgi:cell division protein FtsB
MRPRSSAARTEAVRVRNERGLRRCVRDVIRRCHGFRSILDRASKTKYGCPSGAVSILVGAGRRVAPAVEVCMPMARRGRRRTRPSRPALALRWIGALVLVAIAVAYVHPLREFRAARADVAERRAEVERLTQANRELESDLARAGMSAFVEREARRLGLVKPGERLFIVTGIEEWKRRHGAGASEGARIP